MKNGINYNPERRSFIKKSIVFILSFPLLQACVESTKSFLVKLSGTNHILGHRLWAKNFPSPTETIFTDIAIIGGGISGLSASRYFSQNNIENLMLFEMENEVGGNSRNGENKYTRFPLGAHYLPLPNAHDAELVAFLKEENIINFNRKEIRILKKIA